MGNANSGRPRSGRAYLGQLLIIGLKDVKAYLGKPSRGGFNWSSGSSVGFEITDKALILSFVAGKEKQPVRQEIPITYTPCTYGGQRPWFSCSCGRRAAKLYMSSTPRFTCRLCTRLRYGSQSLGPYDLQLAAIRRMQAKLDPKASPSIYDVPQRPKGMHETTYKKIRTGIIDAACRVDSQLEVMLERRYGGLR